MNRWLTLLLLSSFIIHPSSFSGPLPTFEDFRRADRERRVTGKAETPDSVALNHVEPDLIKRTLAENPGDAELLGAAEFNGNWTNAGTNAIAMLRRACALAGNHDLDGALVSFRQCQRLDPQNLAPWLGELWVLRQQNKPLDSFHPPDTATVFEDYELTAARARVHLLEKAGYSPYAARRIGVMRPPIAAGMAQDFARTGIPHEAAKFLRRVAQAMQHQPALLVTELCGQSLEVAVPGAEEERVMDANDRRKQLQEMLTFMEREVVEAATEEQMTRYYDDVLLYGEEEAMRRLAAATRR